MKNRLKHLLCGVSALCMAGSLVFASPSAISTVQAATTDSTFHSTDGTIHFLTLNHNTDAILIECDGKFGMVDSVKTMIIRMAVIPAILYVQALPKDWDSKIR